MQLWHTDNSTSPGLAGRRQFGHEGVGRTVPKSFARKRCNGLLKALSVKPREVGEASSLPVPALAGV